MIAGGLNAEAEPVLDDSDLSSYAASVAFTISRIGPVSHVRLARMLRGLGLTDAQAASVIAFAVARRALIEDGELLRAPRRRLER
jgi:hypothetical protein